MPDRAAIFDIDGTLLELLPEESAAYVRAFETCFGNSKFPQFNGYRLLMRYYWRRMYLTAAFEIHNV
jgi:FMN phosphatase YigB (HAD superfamily)